LGVLKEGNLKFEADGEVGQKEGIRKQRTYQESRKRPAYPFF